MRRTGMILIAALIILVGLPVLAGGKHKCEMSTQECLNKMVTNLKNHGWVGIEGDKHDAGYFVIKKVYAGSPAEKAGLKPGDVVVAMNGISFADGNKDKLKQIKSKLAPGDTMTYTVKRNGSKKDIAIELGEVPDDVFAQWIGEHMLEHATVKVASK